MTKFKSSRWKILVPLLLMLFLVGCASVIGPDGKVMPEKIITLGDEWSFSMGWFDALIVWPLAQFLNFISQYTGVFMGIVILTALVNLAMFPSQLKSQVMNQKMQMINPKIQQIQEKYKGMTDQNSQLRMNTEIQNLYKKNDIKLGSIFIPTFATLPVILALWQAVQRAQVVIDGEFLGNSLFTTPMAGMQAGIPFYFVLFVVLIVVQIISAFLPSYLAKKAIKTYPGQKPPQNNNTMMYVMVAMMGYFGLVMNSAMVIYLSVSAVTRIVQQFYTQKHMNLNGNK